MMNAAKHVVKDNFAIGFILGIINGSNKYGSTTVKKNYKRPEDKIFSSCVNPRYTDRLYILGTGLVSGTLWAIGSMIPIIVIPDILFYPSILIKSIRIGVAVPIIIGYIMVSSDFDREEV